MTSQFYTTMLQLDESLRETQWIWQESPFKAAVPNWIKTNSELAQQLLNLDDTTLHQLQTNIYAACDLIGRYVPSYRAFINPPKVKQAVHFTSPTLSPHILRDIPGRKLQQVLAFGSTVHFSEIPLLDWCGGKGHLGRVLSALHHTKVATLERDPALCSKGRDLAVRDRMSHEFLCVDVLSPTVDALVGNHHTVALHACGELHRSLALRAVAQQSPALDIAPCCYHLGSQSIYQSMSGVPRLVLTRDDVRIAVTEHVTAAARERHSQQKEMAWKLGFDALRRGQHGSEEYQSLKSIDKSWLRGDFADFCRQIAGDNNISLLTENDWSYWESIGWQRHHEVMRLSLPRSAVRRAIELWLVLDIAVYLEQHDYRVNLVTFCEQDVSPRNLLLSARRHH